MTHLIKIVDIETGTEEIREMNASELAAYEKSAAETEAELLSIEAQKQAKASAQAKLAALGLTAEEIAALTK